MIWTDKEKFELFGHTHHKVSLKKKGVQFDEKYTLQTIKPGGGLFAIMLGVVLLPVAVQTLHGRIDSSKYEQTLEANVIVSQ